MMWLFRKLKNLASWSCVRFFIRRHPKRNMLSFPAMPRVENKEADTFYDNLNDISKDGKYANDKFLTRAIATALCEKILYKLTDKQKGYIIRARMYYLDEENEAQRLIDIAEHKIDMDIYRNVTYQLLTETQVNIYDVYEQDGINSIINLSISKFSDDGLDDSIGEELCLRAEQAKIPLADVIDIFKRYLPELN